MTTLTIVGGGTLARNPYVYEERTLVAVTGPADDSLRGATYEWKIGDRIVNTGTNNTYTPDDLDVGKEITVTALLPGSGVETIRVAANNVKKIVGVNDQPTGILFFKVDQVEGGTRYTAMDAILDEDGRGPMSYTWLVGGKPIAGTTGAELVLDSRFAGQTVTLMGTYTDGLGNLTTVTNGDLPVRLDAPGSVGIIGTVGANQSLYANVFDPDGVQAIHYAWDVMDARGTWTNVAGASTAEFTIGATAPAAVRMLVDYADRGGNVAQRVVIVGTDGFDSIKTEGLAESVYAGGGNDYIRFSHGGHQIDGGAGLDTYVIDQPLFSLNRGAYGEWHVGTRNGIDLNHDVLADVERIAWLELGGMQRHVALDIDGHAGQAYRLYRAAFDRAPDEFGIGFWISRLDLGTSLKAVANAFVASDEFKTMYGANPGNAELVAKFYANILDRAPDAEGSAFWTRALDSGLATRADLLLAFSESAEHAASLVGTVQQGIGYVPYIVM